MDLEEVGQPRGVEGAVIPAPAAGMTAPAAAGQTTGVQRVAAQEVIPPMPKRPPPRPDVPTMWPDHLVDWGYHTGVFFPSDPTMPYASHWEMADFNAPPSP